MDPWLALVIIVAIIFWQPLLGLCCLVYSLVALGLLAAGVAIYYVCIYPFVWVTERLQERFENRRRA